MPTLATMLRVRTRLEHYRHGPADIRDETAGELIGCADAMTVAADDVALRNLELELRAALQQNLARGERERLRRRIPMVEVHDVWRKDATAVHTRNSPQIAQPLERRALPRHHSLDFFSPVRGVVRDVVRALISDLGHAQV